MTHYIVAQITITDRATYDRYQAAFMPVLIQYRGRLLAADEAPNTLEGDWDHQKLIMMAFDDEPAARKWFESVEYQAIAEDRKLGSHGVALSVRGF